MAKFTDIVRNTMISYFNAGDQPTEANFTALITAIQEGIEEHQHDGTGDGDSSVALTGVLMADAGWIGIGAALERLVFGVANHVSVMDAHLGVQTLVPGALIHTDQAADVAYKALILSTNTGAEGGVFWVRNDNMIAIQDLAQTTNVMVFDFTTMAVGIGAAPSASTILELSSTTGALLLPRMNTAQRNALGAINGMIIYNSQAGVVQAYENGAWVDI